MIQDAVHNGGNEYFYWLPPMLSPAPAFTGVFDSALEPTVSVCAWSVVEQVCKGPTLFTFTLEDGLLLTTTDEWFGVDWYVFEADGEAGYDPGVGDVFRVFVSVSGTVLGFADLLIVDKFTGKLKKILGDEYLFLSEENGRKFLKIRFRIEEGAVETGELTWSVQPSGTTEHLMEVWGSSANDVYAVGNGAVVLHSDGSTWTPGIAPGLSDDFEFRGLAGIPGMNHDVLAGGCSAVYGSQVWHFNGTDWALWGAFGSKPGCVRGISEGYSGHIVGNEHNLEGRIWVPEATNNLGLEWAGGQNTALLGVWGESQAGTGFAVGINSLLLRNDGSGWVQLMGSPGQLSLTSVWGSSVQDMFVVGEQGRILHYDGVSWTSQTSGTGEDLTEVWGSSGSDVYAVGRSGTVLHYDGSAWTPLDLGVSTALLGVWVSPDGNTAYIVGEYGLIMKGER
jgi:hypothetical protein